MSTLDVLVFGTKFYYDIFKTLSLLRCGIYSERRDRVLGCGVSLRARKKYIKNGINEDALIDHGILILSA